jgi:hypothetical protein
MATGALDKSAPDMGTYTLALLRTVLAENLGAHAQTLYTPEATAAILLYA